MPPSGDFFASSAATMEPDGNTSQPPSFMNAPRFDMLDWYPAYQSCQKYFLDHAQHEPATHALCALINIRLPCQWHINPLSSFTGSATPSGASNSSSAPTMKDWQGTTSTAANARNGAADMTFASLIPYIRRLVVTGFDTDGILHGFFGDAWRAGIGPLHECERRNYLFSAKHGGWRSCKKQYDMNAEETVPFMQPLRDIQPEELDAADRSWSSWLAMEDWMIGPRAPSTDGIRTNRSMPNDSMHSGDSSRRHR